MSFMVRTSCEVQYDKFQFTVDGRLWGYELWIASTHPNGCQQEFKNFCGGDYPLLIKVIQADETLSIQVQMQSLFME